MINRNGVHLPDTTYGGNPIDWNCSSDSDDSLQRLKAENAKLRELAADMFAFLDGADCARFPAGDVVITQAQISNFYDRMSDLGVEVDDG